MRLDADDFAEPKLLECLYQAAEKIKIAHYVILTTMKLIKMVFLSKRLLSYR